MEFSRTEISWPTSFDAMPKLEEGFQTLTVDESELKLEHLCEVCQQIPLRMFFCSGNQKPQVHIGLLKDILLSKMKMACSMCYLIIKAIEQSWTDIPIITQTGGIGSLQRGEVFHRSWKPGQPLITPEYAESMGSIHHNGIVLRYCERTKGVRAITIHIFCLGVEVNRGTSWVGVGGGVIGMKKSQPMLRLLGNDAHLLELEDFGHGRKHSRVCETSLMAMWYDECKDNHPSCSRPRVVSEVTLEISGREEAPEPKLPPDTRFIDVQKMCLVMAKNDCGYVALSYVWGNSDNEGFHTKMQNVVAREADNGLRKLMFPKTIADAISLTAELGIMYLWVDSICIVQDDDGKATQIQSMDRIYGLASLVIVGAAGIDANMGLTGYANSPRTENEQWVQRVHGVQLMVSSPPFGEVLSASKWSTRGWTFQEWYLARRALVFTDQQVYYVCSSSNFSEDIYLDLVPPVAERVDTSKSISSTVLHQLPKRNSPLTIDSGWTEYRQLVESYTPRELTYESDTLLAISGLLNNLHRARKNRFICGVSVADFHNALFWVPVNGTDFRYVLCGKMFPTWSWVGWKGAVTYGVFPASQQSLVENWIVRRLDGQQELLRTPLSEPQNELFVTSEERVNCKSSTVHNEEEDIERIEDIEESTLGSNYLDYCHLIFEASAAPLQISPGTIDNSSSKADALMSLGGRFVGVALLNYKPKMGAEVLTRQWETYLCIAVSISKDRMPYTFEKAFSQLPEDDEWVNVILVGNREKFYFRAGVGQVSKWRWENYAKPEMKSITLG